MEVIIRITQLGFSLCIAYHVMVHDKYKKNVSMQEFKFLLTDSVQMHKLLSTKCSVRKWIVHIDSGMSYSP